jgi:glycosyltransferase involved in cell wall biosynthesis
VTPGAAKYVVISPVKDEAKYLERTIQSVVQQTVRPYRWVIVDDGSRDQTPEIVARHSSSHSWLSAVRHEANSGREPGSAVVHAFSAGLATVRNLDFDFVVKLDADLELPPNYFEELLRRFEQDPRLGIASGVYLELHDGRWKMIQLPEYHAAGASKMIRVQCFKEIGGFVPNRGWDTVDEIKAMTRGWKTRHFAELQFRHLRLEGTAIGFVRDNPCDGAL